METNVTRTSSRQLPRVVLAGLAGDTGKTFVSLGVAGVLATKGLQVSAFKKGPDFIDAQWLGCVVGNPARNLDTFLMPADAILSSLAKSGADIAVVEGNRGLFDGLDAKGSHSTAQLSKLIGAPIVLVVDTTKVTRTVAAQVLGCRVMDPDVQIGGVILNRVGTGRQESLIREAIKNDVGLPVLGAIPRLSEEHLPSRHLGLVTSVEHPAVKEALAKVTEAVEQHVDVSAILELARQAKELPRVEAAIENTRSERKVRIGVLRDRAFSFYYPENLEALEAAGAELVPTSPIDDDDLPAMDAMYAGGGFPEVYAEDLSRNRSFRESLSRRIHEGLPVWAECGGLMYLSRGLVKDGAEYPMVGAIPAVVEQTSRPQGHGYVRARVDGANPFFNQGTELTGHEFHYSKIKDRGDGFETVLEVERGTGLGGGRDGIRFGSVVAGYTHLHALGSPDWATGLVKAAAGENES